jgi:hypothetical protein
MARIDLQEIGRTGLERIGGEVYEEFLIELQGLRGVRIYEEMSKNDPVISAILHAIEMLIRQIDWRVEPGGMAQADQEATEFLESCLNDMDYTWEDTIAEILSMLTFGWSFHEIVYKRRMGDSRNPEHNSRFDDGRIGWRRLPIRAQSTLFNWEFGDNGQIEAMIQQAAPDYHLRTIPADKALLFRTTSQRNNPEGRSVLRGAYRPWFFKKHIETIEGIGIERDLAGLPVAWVPPELLASNAPAEDRAILEAIKRIVTNVRRDEQEGIIFPLVYDENGHKLYDFSLMSTGGTRQFNTDQIIARYDQRIAMTVLADFILLGHEKVGSFSLASSKTHLFSVALGAWVNSIVAVFNRVAIPKLFKLNDFRIDKLPKLATGDVEVPDLRELGEYISRLSGAGMELFPDDDLENHLRQMASLPKKDPHDH